MPLDDDEQGTAPLTEELLSKTDAYWRAANNQSVGQIYLLDNPLLRDIAADQQLLEFDSNSARRSGSSHAD